MKSFTVAAGTLVFASAAHAQGPDLAQVLDGLPVRWPLEFRIVDPRSLTTPALDAAAGDRPVFHLSETDRELPVSAIPSELRRPPGADVVLVDTLSIRQSVLMEVFGSAGDDTRSVVRDFADLSLYVEDMERAVMELESGPADSSVSMGRDASPGLREGAALLALSIDGNELILAVVESVADIDLPDVRHVTAAILNGDGYLRFAIDESAGVLAGTVQTSSGLYRILSHPSEAAELVFRIPPRAVGDVDRYLALTGFLPASAELQQLERRHLLAEALGDIQPSSNIGLTGGRVQIRIDPGRHDGISHVDVSRLESPEMIARLMKELAPLVGANGDEEYHITRIAPGPDEEGWIIEFRQLVNGFPFRRSSGSLGIGPEGDVRRLQVRALVDASELIVEPLQMTLAEAEVLALGELGQRNPGTTIEGQGQVVYDYDGSSENRLVPLGQFTYVGGETTRAGQVFVLMHTGEVVVLSRRRPEF